MAQKIMKYNHDHQTPTWERINLEGIFLNNPCTLSAECNEKHEYTNYTMHYLKNHYFLSEYQTAIYKAACVERDSERREN